MICFRYMANTETYLKNVALKHMPPNLQKVSLLKSGEYTQGSAAAGVWGVCSVQGLSSSTRSVEAEVTQ